MCPFGGRAQSCTHVIFTFWLSTIGPVCRLFNASVSSPAYLKLSAVGSYVCDFKTVAASTIDSAE